MGAIGRQSKPTQTRADNAARAEPGRQRLDELLGPHRAHRGEGDDALPGSDAAAGRGPAAEHAGAVAGGHQGAARLPAEDLGHPRKGQEPGLDWRGRAAAGIGSLSSSRGRLHLRRCGGERAVAAVHGVELPQGDDREGIGGRGRGFGGGTRRRRRRRKRRAPVDFAALLEELRRAEAAGRRRVQCMAGDGTMSPLTRR